MHSGEGRERHVTGRVVVVMVRMERMIESLLMVVVLVVKLDARRGVQRADAPFVVRDRLGNASVQGLQDAL
jgi:hypothetical protein